MVRTEAPASERKPPATATHHACRHRAFPRLYLSTANRREDEEEERTAQLPEPPWLSRSLKFASRTKGIPAGGCFRVSFSGLAPARGRVRRLVQAAAPISFGRRMRS